MRLRIVIAFIAVLVVSLFLAGIVSLSLVARAATDRERSQVLRQTLALAASTHGKKRIDYTTVFPLLNSIEKTLAASVGVTAQAGKITSIASLPGIPASVLNATPLLKNKAVSGTYGPIVYAIAPLISTRQPNDTTQVLAIGLESRVSFSSDNIWYFLLAGGISLLVAAGLAAIISRRISGHVVAASAAAQRIAGGDFATRVAVSGGEYPELAALGSSLNAMAQGLERSRNLDRQFLLSVSHDLRTPLTSIRGYAEAIADGATDDPKRAGAVLVSEADRLARLIGDLLDLARIDAHQFSLHLEAIDAGKVVSAAAEALRYEFAATGIAITLRAPEEPLYILGDPDRLRQIVANLVENALKFAENAVLVAVEGSPNEILLSVEDDGQGIAPGDMGHVFERHFTSGKGKSTISGSGLGLAIVAELAAAMQGHAEVISPVHDHHGTRFVVRFPRPQDVNS